MSLPKLSLSKLSWSWPIFGVVLFFIVLIIILCVFLIPGVLPGNVAIEPNLNTGNGGSFIGVTIAPFAPFVTIPEIKIEAEVATPTNVSVPIPTSAVSGTLEPIRIRTWAEYDKMVNSSNINDIFLVNNAEYDLIMADALANSEISKMTKDTVLPYADYVAQFLIFLDVIKGTVPTSAPIPVPTVTPSPS